MGDSYRAKDLRRESPRSRRRAAQGFVALVVAVVPFMVAVPSAFASVAFSVAPTFQSSASVGQTNLPAALQLRNGSNGAQSSLNVTVNSITLVPSCGTLTPSGNGDCPAASADPGVFKLSATATGEAGTSCAGITFTISVVDAPTGKVGLTPSATVVLGPPSGPNAVCRIDFTYDVLKQPTKAAGSSGPNAVRTGQIAFASGTASDTTTGAGLGTSTVDVASVTQSQQSTRVTVTAGVLSISLANASVGFGSVASGSTSAAAAVGDIVYTNTLGDGLSWSATVAATSLTAGGAVIPFTGLTYSPGATITPGAGSSGTLTPGATGAFAGADPTPGTSFSSALTIMTGPAAAQGTFTHSGSNATLHVPAGLPAGSYSGTLQYTVTG